MASGSDDGPDGGKSVEHTLIEVEGHETATNDEKPSLERVVAETTPSEDVAQDMEVDKEGESPKDDVAENDETRDGLTAERRTSKRQRAPTTNRFEPGEGGGLASKKPKVSGDASPPGQPNPPPSVEVKVGSAGIVGGEGDAKKATGEKEPAPQEWTGPSYRWIDAGEKNDVAPSQVDHQGAEIVINKMNDGEAPSTFIVRPGDTVMMSSDDAPWDDAKQSKEANVSIYSDPASREAGFGSLDPYIAQVERLWEEVDDVSKKGSGKKKKQGKSGGAPEPSKMMVRVRWFFKREDIEGLKGDLIIEGGTSSGPKAKGEFLANMSSQDLILTDRSDDNSVSTILGKVEVLKKKPLEESSDKAVPKGAYICQYDLSFGTGGVAKLLPYGGATEHVDNSKVTSTPSAKRRDSKDIDASDPTSTDDEGGKNYAAAFSQFPMSPRRIISEGTTVGKIKVGDLHQAVIPPQLDLDKKTSLRGLTHPPSQRIPTMVWDPEADNSDDVDKFLGEACNLITEHLKKSEDFEPFHDVNYIESTHPTAEAKKPREANIDLLLAELHECRGDASKAINKVLGDPEKYTCAWSKSDKEQFDIGYRTYRESLRMIAKSLGESKSCKDTVDYQYRFKLVENFRRFKRKKREKAEEIMATVEDRMLNEKAKEDARNGVAAEGHASGSDDEEEKVSTTINEKVGSNLTAVPTTHAGPVNNRIRTWFKSGGGDENAVGATQQRRNRASDLMTQVVKRVGKDAYGTLAKSLKACNTSNNTLADVKATAKDVLQSHPDLLEKFIDFLPKQVRAN